MARRPRWRGTGLLSEFGGLAHRDATFQHEGADLVDDARALRNQPLTNTMQRLQVELVSCLGGDELHCWPLHSLGDRLGIVEIVLLPLRIGPQVLCRHQSGVMAETGELAGKVMRANTGLDAKQAGWHVAEPRLKLTARPLPAQDDRATIIVANCVQ